MYILFASPFIAMFSVLFAILVSILLAILHAILFTIWFAIMIQMLFLNIGPIMFQKNHTGSMTCFLSHFDFSERLQKN